MTNTTPKEFILNVSHALGHSPIQQAPLRPSLPVAPAYEDLEQAIEIFSNEITKLSGEAVRLKQEDMDKALSELVNRFQIRKAAIWRDDQTAQYALDKKINALGVEVMPADADKQALATCDLGITTVDFFIPETGTIGLLSSAQKPKPVSLLPRVHLALVNSTNFRPSLSIALEEFKSNRYLTLITGPSRTSDIELILTLGVHGPRYLIVWYIEDK